MPSLGTATKLARGLRELRDDADTPQYLGLVAAGNTNPTARVEYALRADELLSEPQVRQIMEYYLAVRMRRYGRTFQPAETSNGTDRTLVRYQRPVPSASPVGAGSGPPSARCVRSHAPPIGSRGATSTHQGTTRIRPPRSGSRGSERRRLGRRRSRFPALAAWRAGRAPGYSALAARPPLPGL